MPALASAALFAALLFNPFVAAAESSESSPPLAGFAGEPMVFFENVGQLEGPVQYAGRLGGLAVFAHDEGFCLRAADAISSEGGDAYRGAVLNHVFEHKNPASGFVGADETGAHVSFLRGNDPSRWAPRLKTFATLQNQDLYPGVDLVLKGDARRFEYDLVAAPGVDLSAVSMRIDGADHLRIAADGTLQVETRYGVLQHDRPRTVALLADGSRQVVEARYYLIDDHRVGFQTDAVPAGARLLLDPTIAWSTYLGGVADEHDCGTDVADDCGCFLTGDTLSLDFPTTIGAFDETYNLNIDAFCTNMIGNGTKLLWSTYLGGSENDFGHGVRLGAGGVVNLTGGTGSANFPATAGAYDTTFNGAHDIWIARLTADGSNLIYSTFLGGASDDGTHGGQAISMTPAGQAAIAGYSSSLNFPVTKGAPDTTQNDGGTSVDGVVAILSADGSSLVFSTYLGGAGFDIASAIDVDPMTNVVVTGGWSTSANFPVTVGAWATTPNGADNGFVVKFDAARNVQFSSLLGSTNEVVRDVACETNGSVLATGYTSSAVLPTTPGVFQPTNGGGFDGFVARFQSDGSAVTYVSYLGGSQSEAGNAIDLDGVTGDAYICGLTESQNFPVTAQAFDPSYNGGGDAFATRVSADGKTLVYSTFLGGAGADVAYAARAHGEGSLYVSGATSSIDFPVTNGVFDTTANGGSDVFMTLLPVGVTSCPAKASSVTYGAGKAGQNGVPTLTALTAPMVPSVASTIRVANGAPNAPLFLLLGVSNTNTAFDGGTLLVNPLRVWPLGALDGAGMLDFSLAIDDNPNYCGKTMYSQVWILDQTVQTPFQLSMTPGLALTFGN